MSGARNCAESRHGAICSANGNPRKKPNRRWTREENALIAHLYEQGVSPSQIACRVGASRYMIEAKLRKWGIERTLRSAAR